MDEQIELWSFTQTCFAPEQCSKNESLFATGNGYIGFRGDFEEYLSPDGTDSVPGTFLNGFFEHSKITYGEIAYGYPEFGQTMLNVANTKKMAVYIGGERFSLFSGEVSDFVQTLDFRRGVLERSLRWRSPKGSELSIRFTRLVSHTRRNVAAIRCEVTLISGPAELKIVSPVDGDTKNLTCETDSRVGSALSGRVLDVSGVTAEDGTLSLVQSTQSSDMSLCAAAAHHTENAHTVETSAGELSAEAVYTFSCGAGETVTLDKFIAYQDSRYSGAIISGAMAYARQARADGFLRLLAEQRSFMDDFWHRADIRLEGDPDLQRGLRFAMFHMLQSAGRDGTAGIASKGLTGEGYEGHSFWDGEVYNLPFFICSAPDIARGMLVCRHSMLDKARLRAREMGHSGGALFPWRTVDGGECSPNYPSGTAQYHINADIAYGVKQYYDATGDDTFMLEYGLEMLLETARLWFDLGFFGGDGRFRINCVTGPDEYTAVVNNNVYTNVMAKMNLRTAARMLDDLRGKYPAEVAAVCTAVGLGEDEPESWLRAGDSIYLPECTADGLIPQCDGFFDLQRWDFDSVPKERYPLLLHYHPLVIYRHQVCKQADLIQAFFMLPDEFDGDTQRKNYDYYEKITTHDSSLSNSVFGIMASRLGYREKAYDYFTASALMDIADSKGNTRDGLHIANMGGTWMGIVYGFAGMRMTSAELSFRPSLPDRWTRLSFSVAYRGSHIRVDISAEQIKYTNEGGSTVVVRHFDRPFTLCEDESVSFTQSR